MDKEIQVLVVDDNLRRRRLLSGVLESIRGVEVLLPAADGRIALARMKNNSVDLVFLDMHLSDMKGLKTLRLIRDAHPETGVIMMGGEDDSEANMVIQSLELGALDYLPKSLVEPGGSNPALLKKHLTAFCSQVLGRRYLSKAKQMSSPKGRVSPSPSREKPRNTNPLASKEERTVILPGGVRDTPLPSIHPGRIDVVVVGVSTGGPIALGQVISGLPEDIGVPILIVQHMPAVLTLSLARSLNAKSVIEVREAAEGEVLKPGTAYVAQGGKHLLVKTRKALDGTADERFLTLDDGPPENSVRPSADVLFRSVAKSFKGHTLAVIMTGMGNDGMRGVSALKEKGCYCITQSPESCVVYGMPKAVVDAGFSDENVELPSIAARITELVRDSKSGRAV